MPEAVSIKPDRDSNIQKAVYQFLDTNGDGTGTKNANVDGDPTPVLFKYVAQPNQAVHLHRLVIHIADNGDIQPHLYGALAALANGVSIGVYDASDNLVEALDGGVPIKTNGAWGRVCYDVDQQDRGAGNDGYINVRWTFSKAGQPLQLEEGEYLQVTIADDLTGLLEHYFQVQGYRV